MKLSFTKLELTRFNKRTYQLFANVHNRFEKVAYKLELSCAVNLPLALGFLRVEAQKAIGEKCIYCMTVLTIKTLSLDHKIPISRSQEFIPYFSDPVRCCPNHPELILPAIRAFDWSNCRFCCLTCNKRKGELTDLEFAALLEKIENFPPAAKRYIRAKLSARLPFHKKAKGAAA